MTTLDRIILLATGLVAAYLIYFFAQRYRAGRKVRALYFLVSFAVLLIAGLLLILFTYDALANPLVVVVSVLIPAGISLGLVSKYLPSAEKGYLLFVLVGLAAIAVTRFTGPSGLATPVLAVVHSVAGLLIFFLPIRAVSRGEAKSDLIWVTVGGGLIGLGGIALAFLKSGSQLLFFSQTVVFAILAPLLLLMALAFAWGFVKGLPEV